MNNFDDIFEGAAPAGQSDQSSQPFDKDAWADRKKAERQSVYGLADATAEAVSTDGGKFREYLDVQARFDRYSATNALLVLAQMPQATQIRDYDGWKDAGVSVKRHPKSISILEPGDEYQREDGSVGTYYNVKRVYDISQTTASSSRTPYRSFPPKGEKLTRSVAPPLPTKSGDFAGTPTSPQPTVSMDDRLLLKALISRPPVPMQMADELPNNMGAYYDHDQQVIFVRRGMEASDIFRSVSKELAHAELAAAKGDYSRQDAAFAAYSVSYLLCRKYGIDASSYDFSRLPDCFRESDPQGVRAALTEIRDTAGEISGRMYRVLEQNKPPKTKEQER